MTHGEYFVIMFYAVAVLLGIIIVAIGDWWYIRKEKKRLKGLTK